MSDHSANTRGERLKASRAKFFKSASAAAVALGVPLATYGAHERAETPGGRDFGPDEAKNYARRFGVSPEWLLLGVKGAEQIGDPPIQEDDLDQAAENALTIEAPRDLSPAGIKAWISKVSDEVGTTPTQLARAAQLAASTVNKFLRDEDPVRSLTAGTVEKLLIAARKMSPAREQVSVPAMLTTAPATLTLPEGTVTMEVPAKLSDRSRELLSSWVALLIGPGAEKSAR